MLGHATSENVLHWTECDVVLKPGDDGVFSGCIATPEQGTAALFYATV